MNELLLVLMTLGWLAIFIGGPYLLLRSLLDRHADRTRRPDS